MKVETCEANWGAAGIRHKDIAVTRYRTCLRGRSISYGRRFHTRTFRSPEAITAGSGTRQDRDRFGTFWPFWKLIRGLTKDGRAPRAVVLENLYGCLTSREGKDFASIASALAGLDYRFRAAVVDAVHFVPRSRPRAFL